MTAHMEAPTDWRDGGGGWAADLAEDCQRLSVDSLNGVQDQDPFDIWTECVNRADAGAFALLNGMGVPGRVLWRGRPWGLPSGYACFGIARIVTEGRRFDFSIEGRRAVVQPVNLGPDGSIDDFIAWSLAVPCRWWLWNGTGRTMNVARAHLAYDRSEEIRLHPTPLELMQAGFDGVCIVSQGRPAWEALDNAA